MEPVIHLTPDEICVAAFHGVMRRRMKLNGSRSDREQDGRSSWDNELEGMCAELAYCKWRGIYPTGIAHVGMADGGMDEVRWTKHTDSGGLIVYPKDRDGARLFLLDGFAPSYRIVGWLHAGAAKQSQFRTDAGYYLVPRSYLHSVEAKR